MSLPFKETFYQLLVKRGLRYVRRQGFNEETLYYQQFYIGAENLSDEELMLYGTIITVHGGNEYWYEICLEYCLAKRIGLAVV